MTNRLQRTLSASILLESPTLLFCIIEVEENNARGLFRGRPLFLILAESSKISEIEMRKVGALTGFLVFFAGLAAWQIIHLYGQNRQRDDIEFLTGSLTVGPTLAQSSYPHSIVITNRSDSSIRVQKLVAGCSCLTSHVAPAVLGPGKTMDLPVELNLSKDDTGSWFEGLRVFTATFVVEYYVDSSSDVRWSKGKLQCSVKDAIKLDSSILVLPTRHDLATQTSIQIPISVANSDARLELNCAPESLIAGQISRLEKAPQWLLTLDYKPNVRRGSVAEVIELLALSSSNEELGRQLVYVNGLIESDVLLSSTAFYIGAVRTGERKSVSIVIRSEALSPLELDCTWEAPTGWIDNVTINSQISQGEHIVTASGIAEKPGNISDEVSVVVTSKKVSAIDDRGEQVEESIKIPVIGIATSR